MTKNYAAMSLRSVLRYLDEAAREKVSVVARGSGGFIRQLRRYGAVADMPVRWQRKRNAFIARHLAQYNSNRTRRRKLALYMWAYDPGR